jgi:GTP-binding protein
MKSDTNLATLDHYAYKQKFEAGNGRPGSEKRSSGLSGGDLYLGVPVGTLVKLKKVEGEEKIIDFDKPGMEVLIAKGGKGGRGNWHFKSPTNTTPLEFEVGKPGEEWQAELELKILADVGLIGLPNVGKSTLLSVLSSAKPKIANYPFTTLEPNLGVLRLAGDKSVVLADIPGLIEGASEGKGLGLKFLQHIERTRVLVHVLAGEDAQQLYLGYKTVREELKQYGRADSDAVRRASGVTKKKELVVLNKTDLLDEGTVGQIVIYFKKKRKKILPVSCGNLSGVEVLKKELRKLL